MAVDAFGIVTTSMNRFKVKGLQDYRPIGAFSFLGRYRIIDFPVSNLSNSNIDRIQVYVSEQNPRSIAEHLGSGQHHNINSKRGKLQLLFKTSNKFNPIYDTDIQGYRENLPIINRMYQQYAVIVPGYSVFKMNFDTLVREHIASGADITMVYHHVNDAKQRYANCKYITLNRQKGVKTIELNDQQQDERNIFIGVYVMKKDLLVDLVNKAQKVSSIITLSEMIGRESDNLDIRGYQHKGYYAAITDFESYYKANLELLDMNKARELFTSDWPIYTVTTDSCPVHYFKGAEVRNSMVANGSLIQGTVENSVIGRDVKIRKGAVVRNSIILGHSEIGENVHLECQVVDKWARVIHASEIIGTPENPGYIKREDII